MRLGVSAALVDHELIPGDVEVDDGAIAAVGLSPAARAGIALPGYIDLQVNGFGGADFLNTDRDGYGRAAQALLSTGVTAFQPTLVSSPPERTLDAIAVAAQAMPALKPRLLGVHLEGPFISPRRKGAHDERWIIPPSLPMLERLCASGIVATVTVAPELPGARDLIRWLVGHHVLVSLGHTDADAAAAHAAYDLGARSVTHLHNAQRPFSSRDPGIAAVAMTRADVTVQLIA
ncbi:MAG: amidohydrolase family protein, partial [Solirubrobacteraceae bacterium]